MSELNDYLEGKITFEEFEKRREERKAKDKEKKGNVLNDEEAAVQEDEAPSTSKQPVKAKRKRKTETTEEGVSPSVQQAFASMIGEGLEECVDDDDDDEDGKMEWKDIEEEDGDDDDDDDDDDNNDADEEEEDGNGITPGDVFALEMELNRENKKMMKERRHRSKLPRALRGLMGEANIRYARGDKEDAILMCMEIIRQAPVAYEPFSTMAMIYEDQGDMEKALQFGLIAAHLNPSDCEEWVKLADMSLEQDNIKQAIICYTKAIKYDSSNVQYLWERSSLYEQVGEHKQAMDGYRRILSLLPPTDGEHFMQLSRDMAKSYYESSELPSAIGVMEEALERHPELVTHECVNMAAELFIANHQHDKALEALVKFCGIVLKRQEKVETKLEEQTLTQDTEEDTKEDTEEEKGKVIEVVIPDAVPIDIRAKMMVCLIHQQVFKPLDPMLTSLMEQSPEELGDLYLDVAEAFMEEGEYNSALPLLSALVCSERYNLAVVWLRHAGYILFCCTKFGKEIGYMPS
ncbi:general transcription factor 3C polypeptide 3 isoform X1 [Danio rerio]|uniref:General transcription factor 3C polypeptide 3 isoform X1 n=1 Tax=Danio rerio TaxID=7955 RepID=A0AC58J1H2_DANRE